MTHPKDRFSRDMAHMIEFYILPKTPDRTELQTPRTVSSTAQVESQGDSSVSVDGIVTGYHHKQSGQIVEDTEDLT